MRGEDLDYTDVPTSVQVAGQTLSREPTRGDPYCVGALLTVASWVLARAGGLVADGERAALLRALHGARELTVAVHITGAPAVQVIADGQLLLSIPTARPRRRPRP